MPNHCKNRMTVLGDTLDVDAFVKRANAPGPKYAPHRWDVADAIRRGVDPYSAPKPQTLSFHAFIPIPEEVQRLGYSDAGYEAERQLWGVKWGAYDDALVSHEPGCAVYVFTTAWAPPERFLETVSRELRGLTFMLSFDEEYPSRGRFVVCGGIVNVLALDSGGGPHKGVECDSADDVSSCSFCAAADVWRETYVTTHDAWANEERALRIRT
jgi:hypothetical protein